MVPFKRMLAIASLAIALGPRVVFAQPVTAATPPVVLDDTAVPYPVGGEGDARVVLEILVDATGRVREARIVEGNEPFGEAAWRAVMGWRFAPAKRGEVAVSARIKARVDFRQELAAKPKDAMPPENAGEKLASVPPTAPEEVSVRGARREVGQTTLSSSDVRQMPGAFGDPFRAIEALPGVTPIVSGAPYFYVRGAPPADNGYFVDGVRVPLLFHVGLGQGVIHPGLLDHVDFYPGTPPASYGGLAGAIIAGQTRQPSETFRGEANLRLLDAGALVEAPFGDGRGSALVAARYGYPGLVLSAITKDIALGYWDYQSRATWKLSPRDTIGVLVFGSHDYLATAPRSHPPENGPPRTALVEQLVSDFHRIDARYDHTWPDGRVRVGATIGYDAQGAEPTYTTNRLAAVRLEIEQRLSPEVLLRTGAGGDVAGYRFRQVVATEDVVTPSSASPAPTNVHGGIHADVVWQPTQRVEIVLGGRVDVFASSRGGTETILPAADPRLSTRVKLTERLAWTSAFGLTHQYPTLRVGAIPTPLLALPGFRRGTPQLQTAARASEGVEIALPASFVLSATAFLSAWSGLTDATSQCTQLMPGKQGPRPEGTPPDPIVCPNDSGEHGRAYGLELLVRRSLSRRLGGWLSYTLSRSRRVAHFLTATGGDARAIVASEGDRTHVLNAILAYDLGRRWRVGGRFLAYSGSPYSKLDGTVPLPPYNDQRYPPFFRFDVRVEKRWPVGEKGAIAFVFEAQNVTLSKEVHGLDCRGELGPTGETTVCTPATTGPITLPSVGVEAFF